MILVAPDTSLRVANSEQTKIRLDVDVAVDTCVITPRFGEALRLAVEDGAVVLPVLKAPNTATLAWQKDGVNLFTSEVEVVSRHYFKLDELRHFGDGQDEFSELDDSVLFMARQAATEVFEQNARRSFVRRIGRTKDYGRNSFLHLAHGDVCEPMTPGYRLVSDCQAINIGGNPQPFPLFVEYVYGLSNVPAQVSRAVLELAAYMLRPSNRPVGATGESSDAGYIHFTTAGRDGATDIPEVNAAIAQFGREESCVW